MPIPIFNSVASFFLKRRISQIELFKDYPIEVQQEVLRKLRSALKHSRVMIHQPLGGASGQATDIEITAREILKLKDELYKIISKHSGQTYKKVNADSDRDYWMKSDEAHKYGMVDEVLK